MSCILTKQSVVHKTAVSKKVGFISPDDWVYSFNPTSGRISVAKVVSNLQVERVINCYRITTNRRVFYLPSNNRILLKDGSVKRIEDLGNGDILLPFRVITPFFNDDRYIFNGKDRYLWEYDLIYNSEDYQKGQERRGTYVIRDSTKPVCPDNLRFVESKVPLLELPFSKSIFEVVSDSKISHRVDETYHLSVSGFGFVGVDHLFLQTKQV